MLNPLSWSFISAYRTFHSVCLCFSCKNIPWNLHGIYERQKVFIKTEVCTKINTFGFSNRSFLNKIYWYRHTDIRLCSSAFTIYKTRLCISHNKLLTCSLNLTSLRNLYVFSMTVQTMSPCRTFSLLSSILKLNPQLILWSLCA